MFQYPTPVFEFRGPLGIPIQIAGSLAFLVAFYVFVSGGSLMSSLGLVAMLVGSILLHELGHAWASEVQGIPVRRIMLYGGGGFCEPRVSASAWQQEFIVAMGPIVNLALWALSSLIAHYLWRSVIGDASLLLTPAVIYDDPLIVLARQFEIFAMINIFLAIFNLLPVQPLDGGKLLHLTLLRLTPPRTAMRATGSIGLIVSVLWVPVMLVVFGAGWWILFFIPSIPLHFAMARGRLG